MSKTFYELLDVPSDASEAAIRDAYREKVKEYHPDVSDRPDAAERFKRVKRAEEVLSDPVERAAYDRLGHETYLDADVGSDVGRDGSGDGSGDESDGDDAGVSTSGPTTVEDVREAAARSAGREHTSGGRSAGWRERERRASQRRAADWFGSDGGERAGASTQPDAGDGNDEDGTAGRDEDWFGTGFDYENPGSRWTYRPPDEDDAARDDGTTANGDGAATSGQGEPASEEVGAAGPGDSGDATAAAGSAGFDGVESDGSGQASTAAGAARGRGPSASSGPTSWPPGAAGDAVSDRAAASRAAARHAATEAWGNEVDREHTHAVHEWTSAERRTRIPRPNWTQDDVVLLAATMFLFPIFLLLTAFPAFHLTVNLVAGLATLTYVAALLPRPSMALPVFGTWSVGMPALLLGFDVPLASAPFVVAVGGVWVPFLFAVAVASVLVR